MKQIYLLLTFFAISSNLCSQDYNRDRSGRHDYTRHRDEVHVINSDAYGYTAPQLRLQEAWNNNNHTRAWNLWHSTGFGGSYGSFVLSHDDSYVDGDYKKDIDYSKVRKFGFKKMTLSTGGNMWIQGSFSPGGDVNPNGYYGGGNDRVLGLGRSIDTRIDVRADLNFIGTGVDLLLDGGFIRDDGSGKPVRIADNLLVDNSIQVKGDITDPDGNSTLKITDENIDLQRYNGSSRILINNGGINAYNTFTAHNEFITLTNSRLDEISIAGNTIQSYDNGGSPNPVDFVDPEGVKISQGQLEIEADVPTILNSNNIYLNGTISGSGNAQGVKFYDEEGVFIEKGNLFVKDKIVTTDLDVVPNGQANWPQWADYVFASDYKLRSLEKLEKFVTKHQHLPEVPKAEEIETEGYNLVEMNTVMMKKIEELTLYIIDLHNENKELRSMIEAINED